MHLFYKILIGFLTLIFSFCLSLSQSGKGEPIYLEKADSLVGTRTDIGNVRSFEGNVVFYQGKVKGRSDKAVQYLDENRAELLGNVVITQDEMILKSPKIDWNGNEGLVYGTGGIEIKEKNQFLTAEKGFYNTRTRIADFKEKAVLYDDTVKISCDSIKYYRTLRKSFAYGNVKVEDDSTILLSDYGEYNRLSRESHAYGNVVVIGKFNRTYLGADTILNIPEKQYSLARGNPVFNQIDSAKKSRQVFRMGDSLKIYQVDSTWYEYDTTSITSKIMEQIKEKEDIFLFRDSVNIVRKNLSSSADEATIFKNRDLITLKGKPVVWYDSTQLHADSIIIRTKDNKLQEIHSFGNALAATKDDTMDVNRINQIIGNEILIRFSQDTIRAIFSNGNAKSLYFMQNEKGEDGLARNSSDSIFIEFVNGKTENIHWLGGIQGEYFPEILVNSVYEFYLPGFRWKFNKPLFVLNKYFLKEMNQNLEKDKNSDDNSE